MIVLKLEYIITFSRQSNGLFPIYYHTISLMLRKYFFGAETLETMHTKVFSVLMFGLMIHHSVKIFY